MHFLSHLGWSILTQIAGGVLLLAGFCVLYFFYFGAPASVYFSMLVAAWFFLHWMSKKIGGSNSDSGSGEKAKAADVFFLALIGGVKGLIIWCSLGVLAVGVFQSWHIGEQRPRFNFSASIRALEFELLQLRQKLDAVLGSDLMVLVLPACLVLVFFHPRSWAAARVLSIKNALSALSALLITVTSFSFLTVQLIDDRHKRVERNIQASIKWDNKRGEEQARALLSLRLVEEKLNSQTLLEREEFADLFQAMDAIEASWCTYCYSRQLMQEVSAALPETGLSRNAPVKDEPVFRFPDTEEGLTQANERLRRLRNDLSELRTARSTIEANVAEAIQLLIPDMPSYTLKASVDVLVDAISATLTGSVGDWRAFNIDTANSMVKEVLARYEGTFLAKWRWDAVTVLSAENNSSQATEQALGILLVKDALARAKKDSASGRSGKPFKPRSNWWKKIRIRP